MNTTGRIMRGALALSVVAALAAPITALAIPGQGFAGTKGPGSGVKAPAGVRTPRASVEASRQAFRDQRQAILKQRIELALSIRKLRFDENAARLAARITKVTGFADAVEQAGGDVSAVRTRIAEAASLLERAKAEQAKTVDMFNAVLSATDKKAAFQAARAQARTSIETLKSSRDALRGAVLSLRAIANGLKGAGQ
jgi:ABC-type transporter Mla subunit MlaD